MSSKKKQSLQILGKLNDRQYSLWCLDLFSYRGVATGMCVRENYFCLLPPPPPPYFRKDDNSYFHKNDFRNLKNVGILVNTRRECGLSLVHGNLSLIITRLIRCLTGTVTQGHQPSLYYLIKIIIKRHKIPPIHNEKILFILRSSFL